MLNTMIELMIYLPNETWRFSQSIFDGSTDLLKKRGYPSNVMPSFDHFDPKIVYPPVILDATSYPSCLSNVTYAFTGVFSLSEFLSQYLLILASILYIFLSFPFVMYDPRYFSIEIRFLFAVANVMAATSNMHDPSRRPEDFSTNFSISSRMYSSKARSKLPPSCLYFW